MLPSQNLTATSPANSTTRRRFLAFLTWPAVSAVVSATAVFLALQGRDDCRPVGYPELRAGRRGHGVGVAGDASCDDWIAEPVADPEANNEWEYMSRIPPVSPCLVRGLPIEVLQPAGNFRSAYVVGLSDDVEDKVPVLAHMRGALDPEMASRKRRVLVDFGSKSFDSSVAWFLRNYPVRFTEIHAFEVNEGVFTIPKGDNQRLLPAMSSESRMRPIGSGPPPFPPWLLKRVHPHIVFVGIEDNSDKNTLNATRWLLEELKVTADDAVVVKMDIEGAEWEVLDEWLRIPGMSDIVDELFVEVHYHHATMDAFHWYPHRFNQTRDEAAQMLNTMRRAGFYAHMWP